MGVITGEGSTLSFAADTTFTELASVLSVQPPGWERPAVSTKHLKSTAATKRPGKITDYGQVTFRVIYDPNDTTHATISGMATDLKIYHFKLAVFDALGDAAGTFTFDGFVSAFAPDNAEDEANVEADVTIEVNGAITFAA